MKKQSKPKTDKPQQLKPLPHGKKHIKTEPPPDLFHFLTLMRLTAER